MPQNTDNAPQVGDIWEYSSPMYEAVWVLMLVLKHTGNLFTLEVIASGGGYTLIDEKHDAHVNSMRKDAGWAKIA